MKPVFLIGEARGEAEEQLKEGFVGSSGIELIRMLAEAGAMELSDEDRRDISGWFRERDPSYTNKIWKRHPEFYRTNVFQQHPPANNLEYFCGGRSDSLAGYPALLKSKYVRKEFRYELERLGDEILLHDPHLIVCLGNSALWALTGGTGISKLRGTTCISTYTVADYKLLCAYHPAAVLRQWDLRSTTIADFTKIKRESASPLLQRPECFIYVEPSLSDIEAFINEQILNCEILSVDIETSGREITEIGFAPTKSTTMVIPFHDSRRTDRSYWPTADAERQCWRLIRRVLEDGSIKKLFQNGMYDIAFLWRSYGIGVMGATEDTMLLHHALLPEGLKGLAYMGSLYTDHGPWKSERKKSTDTIKRDA